MDKLIRHGTAKPAPISDVRSDVPAEVLAVIDKMMAKRPADRYQTPAEVAEALRPFAVSGPTPWAPPRSGAAIPCVETEVTPLDGLSPDTRRHTPLEKSDDEILTPSSLFSDVPTSRPIGRRVLGMTEGVALAVITGAALLTGMLTIAGMLALIYR
jgi:hypothetical protein